MSKNGGGLTDFLLSILKHTKSRANSFFVAFLIRSISLHGPCFSSQAVMETFSGVYTPSGMSTRNTRDGRAHCEVCERIGKLLPRILAEPAIFEF